MLGLVLCKGNYYDSVRKRVSFKPKVMVGLVLALVLG